MKQDIPQSLPASTQLQARSHFGIATLFTLTIFVSATLLFVIQPMFARMILPMLGGSPAVWNTAQVFYQVVLLLGYLYAHATRRWLGGRWQIAIHSIVILLPLLALPIAVPFGWQPPDSTNPAPWLLLVLLVSVGLPFFVVSTGSPLIQSWFARTNHPAAYDPYFLYAASNIGSMLSLLAYPFLIEPRVRLIDQSWLWSVGYGVLIVLLLSCAAVVWRTSSAPAATAPATHIHSKPQQPLTWSRRIRWVLLAAVPSSLLLSVTTYLSSNLAPFPLLWIVPLALYLLTFILVFMGKPIIPHWIMVRALPIFLTPLMICLAVNAFDPLVILFPLNLIAFFIATMVCHGEMAADRPAAEHLTEFYVWMSFGGALGGLLTALVAPQIFTSVLEYPIALVLMCLLLWQPIERSFRVIGRDIVLAGIVGLIGFGLAQVANALGYTVGPVFQAFAFGIPALLTFSFSRRPLRYGLALLALFLVGQASDPLARTTVFAARDFFGINRVLAAPGMMTLVHGTTVHGKQSLDATRRDEPLTYYTRNGPLGQMFRVWERPGAQQHVAVVGLGVGSAACYALPDQQWTFYEIDPVVEQIARDDRFFTFLRDCTPTAPVVLGDARLMLAHAEDASYDMMILDAYSSDAIPIHLITREALQLYKQKLAPGGVLMFHISNRYLDLRPILGRLSTELGLTGRIQYNDATAEEQLQGKQQSIWVALAAEPTVLAPLDNDTRWLPLGTGQNAPLWTDDFHSILDAFYR